MYSLEVLHVRLGDLGRMDGNSQSVLAGIDF